MLVPRKLPFFSIKYINVVIRDARFSKCARARCARVRIFTRAARNGSENAGVKCISAHIQRDFGARAARGETAPPQKNAGISAAPPAAISRVGSDVAGLRVATWPSEAARFRARPAPKKRARARAGYRGKRRRRDGGRESARRPGGNSRGRGGEMRRDAPVVKTHVTQQTLHKIPYMRSTSEISNKRVAALRTVTALALETPASLPRHSNAFS